jgi:hypothetical protein
MVGPPHPQLLPAPVSDPCTFAGATFDGPRHQPSQTVDPTRCLGSLPTPPEGGQPIEMADRSVWLTGGVVGLCLCSSAVAGVDGLILRPVVSAATASGNLPAAFAAFTDLSSRRNFAGVPSGNRCPLFFPGRGWSLINNHNRKEHTMTTTSTLIGNLTREWSRAGARCQPLG